MKSFKTKYGHFSKDGREYVITTPVTPRPWINVISNGDYGLAISQTGSGYSWRTHAQLNRLTRWEQDLIKDEWGKYIYLRDEKGNVWSAGWKPVCHEPERYLCRHGLGYSVIESVNFGIASSLVVFVPRDEPLELWKLTVYNSSRKPKQLTLFSFFEWCLGQAPDWHREFHKSFIETAYDAMSHAIFATKRLWEIPTARGHWNAEWGYVAFHAASIKPAAFDTDKETFFGRYGDLRLPAAVQAGRLAKRAGNWLDPIASLQIELRLKPGEQKTVCFLLGATQTVEEAVALSYKYRAADQVEAALAAVQQHWHELLNTVACDTPDDAMNLMLNTWLKYQAISGRLWGRSAYYQTGGAFGFRDQLQDSQIFLPIDPARTKSQILLHARHQFKDGTVYHWWHPISEVGLHNQISDNLLWLPFVVNSYLQETGDFSLLQVSEPFVDDSHAVPLYDHCVRALDRSLARTSTRGLPLIGAGDWNDGLSAVGLDGRGESVWLGHFLHFLLLAFAPIAEHFGDTERAQTYRARAARLREALNEHAWDGEWYYRATKDNGGKIGSRENSQGRIYLNAQTWAVIAGVAERSRAEQVMNMVEQHLEYKAGPLLLYPGYDTPDQFIGYLSRYAAGMRENGGVYTHAATWAVMAEAMLERGEAAYRLFSKINPVNRGMKPEEYFAEPYVTAGNIEGPDSKFYGRGGWTWYTGSAAWLFKAGWEWILGVRPTVEGLVVDPCIPSTWKGFKVRRRFRGAVYDIEVRNPHHVNCGVVEIWVDGEKYAEQCLRSKPVLPVFAAGSTHRIVVTLGRRTE
ncbi:MAG: glycosyl transferase family 36 [candidate division KSB1 bacterium]|nr:glycosyl transferase family 36 [candidate division KSB1 bacterium]MDZ7274315.1 glycosyl transferase family 36 [candidate division KSB1 bacterium]MDZ7287163.1 glycosyl transferase family 36 [candidate division KSB1 bacterium]MDZ7296912.1 glycosyl transferase family 36 [candidate division KSB1 bacterium]MDZ7307865.1 glycosyl transferase family 36 [candidate division KSB1 bacterium]